jgi:exonuclease III
MADQTDEIAHHKHWTGSNMKEKGKHIGARLINVNFQRKLYGSRANIVEFIERCEQLKVDITVGLEPGQGTPTNITMFLNILAEYGYKANYSTRDDQTIGGGTLVITNEKWSKIPTTTTVYEPKAREQRGRIMAVEFDNKISGPHNKLQVIAFHGVNSAHKDEDNSIKQLQWIQEQRGRFSKANPMATTVVAGDTNAAENTYLDTDRQEKEGRAEDKGEEEKDAFVIRTLKEMKLVDMFRARYPHTRAITRAGNGNDTSRLLDRIMVTAEAAANPVTEVGIFIEQFLIAGSDHKMVMVDLPIDSAGIATDRVKIWEPKTITKWVRDLDEVGKVDPAKEAAFKERLDETIGQCADQISTSLEEYTAWIMEAARGTVLKESTKTYPKIASTREMYTPADHKLRANLRALRNARTEIEEEEDYKKTIRRLGKKLKAVAESETNSTGIRGIIKAIRDPDSKVGETRVQEAINKLETHLNKKNRLTRAMQIKKSIKTRTVRFNDSGKLMLKLVINSLMRRHTVREEITSVIEGVEMKYGEEEVKDTVKKIL